jgi:predicted aconitase
VLGARTERYGDFIDLCAAIVGLVPDVGLHTDDGRRGRVQIDVRGMSDAAMQRDTFFAMLGHLVGRLTGSDIPVITGVPAATEDDLKALGAAAASSGAVAMFHMLGVTPEAQSLGDALGGRSPERTLLIGPDDFRRAMAELTSITTQQLGAVAVGTPHFSRAEFARLHDAMGNRTVAADVEFFVSTGRDILATLDAEGLSASLRERGVRIVTDTCTYLTPILSGRPGAVMTNSAKWAWYAPNNLGYGVVFATLEECVESAVRGVVWRDQLQWEA